MRSAIAHRNSEALRGTNGDVCAEFSGRSHEGQGQYVALGDGDTASLMDGLENLGGVPQCTSAVRVGGQHAETASLDLGSPGFRVAQVRLDDLNARRLSMSEDDVSNLVEDVGVDEETVGLHLAGRAAGQQHSLGGRSGLVEQRGVRQSQTGEICDELLVDRQDLETTLGDFRLVRGVGGVPGGVLQDVSTDDRRGQGSVVATSDEGAGDTVTLCDVNELGPGGCLIGGGRQTRGVDGGAIPVGVEDGSRDGVANDLFAAGHTDRLGDVTQVLDNGSDVAAREGARPLEAAPIPSVVCHRHHLVVSLR